MLQGACLHAPSARFGRGRCVQARTLNPTTKADQDRGPGRAPRPRHHLPVGRGGRHRCDGARHPRRHPSITSATAMRVTAIPTQTERKPQDRSVRRAEKRRRQARMLRVCGLIRPAASVCATADTAWGGKHLSSGQDQAILPSSGRPLGECRTMILERTLWEV